MTIAAPKPEAAIARRDLLTLVGTAAAGLAAGGSAFAQSPAFVQLLRSEDSQEYLRALQENRAPIFVGR